MASPLGRTGGCGDVRSRDISRRPVRYGYETGRMVGLGKRHRFRQTRKERQKPRQSRRENVQGLPAEVQPQNGLKNQDESPAGGAENAAGDRPHGKQLTLNQKAGDYRRDNLRDRHQRLRYSENHALSVEGRSGRDEAGKARPQDRAPERQKADGDEEQRNPVNARQQSEANGHRDESDLNQLAFAEHLHQSAHHSTLNESTDQSGECEQISDVFRTERHAVSHEPAFGVQSETGKEGGERKSECEELPEQRSEMFVFERGCHRTPARPAAFELRM